MQGGIVETVNETILIAVPGVTLDVRADRFLCTGAILCTTREVILIALIPRESSLIPVCIVDPIGSTLLFTMALEVCIEVATATCHAKAFHACRGHRNFFHSGVSLGGHIARIFDIID